MNDFDQRRASERKAIDAMHPGNRFRLMAGLPLLPQDPTPTVARLRRPCLCGKPRQRGHIACGKCWFIIPLPLRQELWDKGWHAKGTRLHREAIRNCRTALKLKLAAKSTH